MKNAYQIKLNELKNCQKPFITPNEAAGVLGCDPNYIRVAAKQQTETGKRYLGFPVIRIGNRTKIPREAFLKYITGEIDREIYFPGVKFACTAISVK